MPNQYKEYSDRLRRSPNYFKPARFRHYLTIKELALAIGKDPSWIRKLERDPKRGFPQAVRVQRGELQVRLYSPEIVKEIKIYFENTKQGRIPNDD